MANQQGNGQNGYRNQHRDDDDRRGERDAEYRGMGQSGYGAGRDADDSSMGTRPRNQAWGGSHESDRDPYMRGTWEEGRMGYSQGYSYRDGDRPSFERGMHDYDRGYARGPGGGGYEERSGVGTREQHERGPQGYGGEGRFGYGHDRGGDTREQGGYRQHQTGLGGAQGLQMPRGPHRGKGPKGFQMSDDRIKERVCEALHEDHDVDASDIEVSISKGEVTLMGTVEDRMTKRMAEDCVLQCAGVRDVHNQLRVRR
ncbi:MAG TPA: BON domain-containing protein [Kofleriaceae bacterium]|nr:BON domain-containing protein [Kofleriaceae bacterium]